MAELVEEFGLPEILYQINHVFLPPKLPQEDDRNPDHERKLVAAVLSAISTFQGYFRDHARSELKHARRMIENLVETRDTNGLLDANLLNKNLLGLEHLDTLAIHITCQNSGLLVTRSDNEYLFESMELLASDNDVIACKGRLIRQFPSVSVAIDVDHIVDAGFRSVLIDTLIKLDREPEPDYIHDSEEKKDKQSGENASTVPDTANPRLVTEMIMTVLETVGRPARTPRIRKHTREEVLLQRNWQVPWRRSPLWLFVRVSLQLVLDRLAQEFKAQNSLYKSLMVYLMTCILNYAAKNHVPHDILYMMTAKISRRMLKLNPPGSAPWLSYLEDSVGKVNSALQEEWDAVRIREEKPLDLSELSSLDFQQDTALTLRRLRPYLDQIDSPPSPALRVHPPCALGHHLQRNEGRYLPRTKFTKDPEFVFFELVDFEHSVEEFLGTNRSLLERNLESGEGSSNNAFPFLGFRTQNGNSVYSKYSLIPKNREIRVVVIEPARFHQVVKCHLAKRSLDDGSEFEALSYVWGDPGECSTIRLNGYVFGVTKNLAAALQYLRSRHEDRVIWVDAICINQENTPERSAQVKLMGDIYRTATRVISWLGEDVAPDMKVAKSFLDEVNEFGGLRRFLIDIDEQPGNYKIRRIVEVKKGIQAVWNCFLGRTGPSGQVTKPLPYWHRTWITQEVRLAKVCIFQSKHVVILGKEIEKYYFGDRQLSDIPIDFSKEEYPVHSNYPESATFVWNSFLLDSNLLRLDWIRKYSQKSIESGSSSLYQETLLELLESNRHKGAKDPRDKVFGLLGLVDPLIASHQGLTIDYKRSTRHVYIGTAHAIIESTRSLDIIYSSDLTKNPLDLMDLRLPSWVPDWSLVPEKYQIPSIDIQGGRSTNPTQCLVKFNLKERAETLSACGYQFGVVINSLPLGDIEHRGWKEHIRRRVESYKELSNLVRTLGLELPKDTFIDASVLNIYGDRLDVFKQMLRSYLEDDKDARDPDNEELERFELDILASVHYGETYSQRIAAVQQPFGDKNAAVGLCLNVRQDDIICLFLGCKGPVVLRPVGQEFTVLGAFYSSEQIFGRLIGDGLKDLGEQRWFNLI